MELEAMDLAVPQNCLCFGLRRATRAVTQAYDAALRPVDLTSAQFSLLAMISGNDPATMHDLAAALGMDRTTLTRNLKPLVRDTLVAVEAGKDQRQRLVSLTPDGVRRLKTARRHWQQMQDATVASFGAAETSALLQALAAITARA